jgi:hypothetical protein
VAFAIARKKEWDLPPCWILFYFKRKENSLGTLDVLDRGLTVYEQ